MSSLDPTRWLFILGVNNSGTTLLARLLATHPEIKSLPHEGQFLTDALPHPEKENVVRLWTKKPDVFRWLEDHDPAPALKAKTDWMKHYPMGNGYCLEKSPPNTIRSRWLQQNFTPAQFIVITRHPYAVCEGVMRRTGCSLEEAAHHWNLANEILFQDLPYLNQVCQFSYEDFIESPSSIAARLEAFLGLSTKFDIAAFSQVASHSIEGETVGLKNLNRQSCERLTLSDRNLINKICAPMMSHLGYQAIV